jgi:eukaryotic-like serine/threonine-protein kinase
MDISDAPDVEIIDRCRYQLGRKLADGGMGSVYEAILHGPGGFQKRVAVKTILEEYVSDPHFVEMFVGEAKLVADLVHPNIVQIYQLGRFVNFYYMAMEYIKGANLEQFMRRHEELGRRLPLDIGIFIISRVCRGLEYAHKKRDQDGNLLGVVHRDICPKNVMISSEGEVKITDFGIAKARNYMVDREGEVLLGRIGYMSPEQFQYLPTDHRSDLYSLSVVMFELLTGTSLSSRWEQESLPGQRPRRTVPTPRTLNSTIPDLLERIMIRGLEADPAMRYQRAGELAYDLEYFMYHHGFNPSPTLLQQYLGTLFPDLQEPEREGPAPSLPLQAPVDSH